MNDILLHFLNAFLISAIFTVPITMVTAMIIQRSIIRGKKAALGFLIGASIIEWVYTFFAIYLYLFMEDFALIAEYLAWASVLVFSILAIHHWKRSKTEFVLTELEVRDVNEIRSGLTYNLFNFLILPFWFIIFAYLEPLHKVPTTWMGAISFSTGATLGAALIFLGYVLIGSWIAKRLFWIARYLDRFLSILFVLLTLYQLFSLLSSS